MMKIELMQKMRQVDWLRVLFKKKYLSLIGIWERAWGFLEEVAEELCN